ncbi:hypothetical protein VC279_10950 [Xanthomonas sp. WHRI 10064A]|uniref:hypothetical protein n=1 Tax=unclassified Xanthomonas TaxID=2643310 RepID=UPI002B22E652|nr:MULTISPECIES: hypothetical protein [unclassified Xanthomonas]MEA9587491.1 hypothetical protein [Xanthomonas sp. WHRI 10064B]MEA9615212.1 hypothetical protein [Xanthomonas sp. WHRI 10064A]
MSLSHHSLSINKIATPPSSIDVRDARLCLDLLGMLATDMYENNSYDTYASCAAARSSCMQHRLAACGQRDVCHLLGNGNGNGNEFVSSLFNAAGRAANHSLGRRAAMHRTTLQLPDNHA